MHVAETERVNSTEHCCDGERVCAGALALVTATRYRRHSSCNDECTSAPIYPWPPSLPFTSLFGCNFIQLCEWYALVHVVRRRPISLWRASAKKRIHPVSHTTSA